MTYVLQVGYCTNMKGEVKLAESAAYTAWATYTDRMLHGEPLTELAANVPADSHANRITLFWEPELAGKQDVVICSMFLLCEHEIPVNTQQTAQSRLILPNGV